ncbi:MAG: tubulin-like doman-containing protein, partial [Pseudonocardiaceae bacterium]
MKFQQPMLFLGLGGTGCEVGAQLERRFREEICGPDGTRLAADSRHTRTYEPYELPSFLQFIYADLDLPELVEKRRTAVPGGGHEIAARKTAHVMTDLVPPKLGNSRDVSESLRNSLDSSVIDWLPPIETDPRRGPLNHGAGQFPTVARAVLFETLRQNPDAATGAITRAIDAINTSGAELASFGARLERSCSVFVVFSVAGGTGSGLCYDYLHLVGNAMQQRDLVPTIIPLVLLPSAFPVGSGGGRAAELNAGSSLIDLFRLIDSLVSRDQGRDIGPRGRSTSTEVRYPGKSVRLAANQIQTAYLFGHHSGAARKQDLHRAMVEMMLTLTGAVPQGPDDVERDDEAVQPRYESGAINRVDIADRSPTGAGRRTVATSAVASMTVPVDELLDIVSSRLLAEGVRILDDAPAAESNDPEIEVF